MDLQGRVDLKEAKANFKPALNTIPFGAFLFMETHNELLANFMQSGFWKVRRVDKIKPYWANEYKTKEDALFDIGSFTNSPVTETLTPYFVPPQYDKDWNLLMSVIQKFDRLYLTDEKINYQGTYTEWCDDIDESITGWYEIEKAYPVIVEAIKWYNQFIKNK